MTRPRDQASVDQTSARQAGIDQTGIDQARPGSVRGSAPDRDRTLLLPGDGTAQDLATYLARARRLDPDGAVRLIARDGTLAAYVAVLPGPDPTVLGLRVAQIGTDPPAREGDVAELDVTVPIAAVADRLARAVPGQLDTRAAVADLTASFGSGAGSAPMMAVQVPPTLVRVPWAGITPPRSGWSPVGAVSEPVLRDVARDGIAEVAAGAPAGSGSLAVTQLRSRVWGRDVPDVPGLPAGVALAVDALGFAGAGELVPVHQAGRWYRLSTARGHVLARRSLL
ncbi:MAG: hypothetical protein ACRC35_00190 [Angustibacter sp.]